MCKFLKIARSLIYYQPVNNKEGIGLVEAIVDIFKKSRNNYGARKIKVELYKIGYPVSIRRISRIMQQNGLVSNYTVKQYKKRKSTCNEDVIENIVNREFTRKKVLEVVVSDLTYVNVAGKWNYICVLIDLYNREILGYAAGKNKDAGIVYKAISRVQRNLEEVCIFHTDRGKEFKNKVIEEALETFGITRSLSAKGTPLDNAVAEVAYKVIKTEFAGNRIFNSFEELEIELFDYVNWYNNIRIHGTLGYVTPVAYRQSVL